MYKQLLTFLFIFSVLHAFGQRGLPTAQEIRDGIADEIKSFNIPPEKVVGIKNRTLWTGTDSVKIRLYYGGTNRNLPIIYNIHGGALVGGDLETHDNISRVLANRTHSLVIAIDYAKPPEHPFPAGLNDCYFVYQWIRSHAVAIGGTPSNVLVLGDSGGGLLAAALQVKLSKLRKVLPPKALVLINPATDLRTPGESMYGLVTRWYLNGADPNNSLASPILADNLSAFPHTFIVVCGKDELKPHGVQLAEKLKAAKVKVDLLNVPEEDHLGGLWAATHPRAKPAINAAINYINARNKKP